MFQIRELFIRRQRKDENIQNRICHSRQRTDFLRIFGSLQIIQVPISSDNVVIVFLSSNRSGISSDKTCHNLSDIEYFQVTEMLQKSFAIRS